METNVVKVKLWGMALIDIVSNAVDKFETYAMELEIDEELIKNIKTDFIKI